jgi:hypothetical protein
VAGLHQRLQRGEHARRARILLRVARRQALSPRDTCTATKRTRTRTSRQCLHKPQRVAAAGSGSVIAGAVA